jgi:predicted kinase
MQKSLIHIICGSTGAGKTTYAIALAERISGVRFSIDEWMRNLFWIDTPQPLDSAWSMERIERCNMQIWDTATRIAVRNVPCVLDLGFSQRESRQRIVTLAREMGTTAQLHFIAVPVEERWRRVAMRNSRRGETYQLEFDVTREMFDFVESLWEPPTEEELRACDGKIASNT